MTILDVAAPGTTPTWNDAEPTGGPAPTAGMDFPATREDFRAWFPDEAACLDYLARLRWPHGFVCPACAATQAWRVAGGLWMCQRCGRKTSVTSATVFNKTRTPLRVWFAAVWSVANQQQRCSALALQHRLDLGSYKTAWRMLHRLRTAMEPPAYDRLTGHVEVGEALVGGTLRSGGADAARKVVVLVAVQVQQPRGSSRCRLRLVPACTAARAATFVEDSVTPGSVLLTDGWSGYEGLHQAGYRRAPGRMLAVAALATQFKRWLRDAHQGWVDPARLQAYLNEFAFQFNARGTQQEGLRFYRLLQQAVAVRPLQQEA